MKPLTFVVFSFFLISCSRPAPKLEKAATPVHVAAVELLTPKTAERYSASLLPARQVSLSFRVSGFVDSIWQVRDADGRGRHVDIGDMVPMGAVLAKVRLKDYQLQVDQAAGQLNQTRQSEQTAKAQLTQAEASAAKAMQDFERASALFADKAMTKSDYDSAKSQLDSTRAQVEAARSQVQVYTAAMQASQATLGTANLGLHDTSLPAPFTGALVQRSVEIGSLVAPGAAAFTLADLSSVKASFGVPDVVLVNLRAGGKLGVFAEALPDRQFQGTITNIAAVADSSTRLFQVQVTIPNPQGVLRPGMIATLTLSTGTKTDALPVVPLSAVVRPKEGESGFAVIVVEGKQARRRLVKLGTTFGDRIAVAGVNPGDQVISSGSSLIADGEAVEVIL
jgi:multidrug efflux pump subunit AcrA (membrane-fusion protein)